MHQHQSNQFGYSQLSRSVYDDYYHGCSETNKALFLLFLRMYYYIN